MRFRCETQPLSRRCCRLLFTYILGGPIYIDSKECSVQLGVGTEDGKYRCEEQKDVRRNENEGRSRKGIERKSSIGICDVRLS